MCGGCNGAPGDPVVYRSTLVLDPHDLCQNATVDALTLYKFKVDCVVANNLYTQSSTNPGECTAASDILARWIEVKKQDYKSCLYMEYLPVMQDLVKRIMLSGVCI